MLYAGTVVPSVVFEVGWPKVNWECLDNRVLKECGDLTETDRRLERFTCTRCSKVHTNKIRLTRYVSLHKISKVRKKKTFLYVGKGEHLEDLE